MIHFDRFFEIPNPSRAQQKQYGPKDRDDTETLAVTLSLSFENFKSSACLVRFEGDQVLGIRLCIVIRNKNLGIAYVVNR